MDEISRRVSEAIKNSGYSHRELEEITGIPHSAIQRYASGETKKMPIDRAKKIADATGVRPEYLLCWDDNTNEKKPAIQDEDGILNKEFEELFSQLTTDEKKMFIAQIKGILSNRE